MEWVPQLVDQLEWHWTSQLRPRLDGLTDEEYLWRPVPDAWTVHDGTIDWAWPEPDPPPVTTIAWRIAHVVIGCFGLRNARHFGGPAMGYEDFPYATTASEALAQLDAGYATWVAGVRALGEDGLERPCDEPGWEDYPMAALVLHINREVIHHGAELALLRDLYRRLDRRG